MPTPTSKPLTFEKYQGLGNDFIVVDADDDDAVSAEEAARLCDRRLGVGADGVLLVLPARAADHAARMRVINADGSVPEMCGNGLRCVALHVARGAAPKAANYETDAGSRLCEVELAGDGLSADVAVAMGRARVLGRRDLELPGEPGAFATVRPLHVDMGNPHAVLFDPVTRDDIARLGPRIATHPLFPEGVNAGFATKKGPREFDLVVWERGVGLTQACGTGACAMVAAACDQDLAPYGEGVTVHLPGGDLTITVDRQGGVTMRGPARHVFSGRLDRA